MLAGGRVIEQGTHETLLARAAAYAALHEDQFRRGAVRGRA